MNAQPHLKVATYTPDPKLRVPKQFKPDRSIYDGPFQYWTRSMMRDHPQKFNETSLTPTAKDLELISRMAYESDELADNLAAAILSSKGLAKLFEKGLKEGLASLENPPPELSAFLEYYEQVPEWAYFPNLMGEEAWRKANEEQEGLGQIQLPNFLLDGLGMSQGFFIGANYPAVGRSIVGTGSIAKGAGRMEQTMKWGDDLFGGVKAFEQGGSAVRSSAKVRLAHAFARIQATRNTEWDENYYGLPISDFDNMVFFGGIFTLVDIMSGALKEEHVAFGRAAVTSIQYLLGAPEFLVRMPLEEKSRFFVMVIAHLDDSPETAREVVKNFYSDEAYFRGSKTIKEKVSKELTFFLANLNTRFVYGNEMADNVGLSQYHRGIHVPTVSKGAKWLLSKLKRKHLTWAFIQGKKVVDLLPKKTFTPDVSKTVYRGSFGAFEGED